MPPKEPSILIKMQETISNQFNFGLPEIDVNKDDERLRKYEESLSKDGVEMKFEELEEEDRANNKEKYLGIWANYFWWAEASSSYWWLCGGTHYHGYAPWNALYGWYWISRGYHGQNDVIYWIGKWNREMQISLLLVHWVWCPKENKVERKLMDGKWYTIRDWKSTHDGNWVWLAQRYWWYSWRYWQFVEWFNWLDEPVFMMELKLNLKGPIYWYFGLYRVLPHSSYFSNLFRSLAKSDEHECIALEGEASQIRNGIGINMLNCIDAIALYDGRDVWLFQQTWGVIRFNYNHDMCWDSPHNGEKDTIMYLYQCHYGVNQRFFMYSDGKIRLLGNMNRCVTATGSKMKENVVLNQRMVASSTIDDTEHKPERVSEGKGDSYWASAFDDKTVEFEVVFSDTQVIKQIDIVFKYPPLEFEVVGLNTYGIWESYSHLHHNSKLEVTVKMGIRKVNVVKIIFRRFHPTLGQIRGKSLYGIVSLKAQGVYKAIKFQDCKDNVDSKTNIFNIEYIDFLNLHEALMKNQEWSKAQTNLNQLIPILNQVLRIPNILKKKVAKAKELRAAIEKIKRDLTDLAVKLTMFENYVAVEEVVYADLPSQIAASSKNPGKDCYIIHRTYPAKISGYFWIQPDCTPQPVRVYCDYEDNTALSYAYYGSTLAGKYIEGISRVQHIQHHCAKIGMEPVEIKSKKQLEGILRYITDIHLDLRGGSVIPLGYDYSCRGHCSGRYASLNSETSDDKTDDFQSLKDYNNVINMAFKDGGQDTVGVGMNMGKVFFFKLDSFPIQGLICSTNFDGKGAAGFLSADCLTKTRGNPNFDGSVNTVIKVICPEGCTSINLGVVWGDINYKDDSSVCRAGIHSGAIQGEKGGKLMVVLSEGSKSFEGSSNFGVKSEPYTDFWDRTFTIARYDDRCPIERFERKKKRSSSFIQESSKDIETNMDFLENIDDPEMREQLLKNIKQTKNIPINHNDSMGMRLAETSDGDFTSDIPTGPGDGRVPRERPFESYPNNAPSLGKAFPVDQKGNNSPNKPKFAILQKGKEDNQGLTNPDDKMSAQNKKPTMALTQQGSQQSGGGGGGSGGGGGGGGNDEGQEATEEEDKEEGGNEASKPKDSMEASKLLSKTFDKYNKDMIKKLKLVKEADQLYAKINSDYGPILTTDISSESIDKDVEIYSGITKATTLIITRLTLKAKNKVKDKLRLLQKARLEILKLEKWKPYKEEYYFWITDVYEIWDSPKAMGKPSNWKIGRKAMGNHLKQISQTGNIRCMDGRGCQATILALRYKRFYDAKMKFSFMVRDSGDVGVVFRLHDEFNYYAFEVNQKPGYKRFRKVTKGKSKILAEIRDGGLVQDKWYNFQLEITRSGFVVKMGLENDGLSGDQLPKVLEMEDQLIASGGVGFIANNNNAFFIDGLELHPIDCTLEKEIPVNIEYLPPECNRFKEIYFGNYEHRWRWRDPKSFQNGPGDWDFSIDVGERKKAIYQSSRIKSSYPDKVGTISWLEYKKVFKDGYLSVEFFAKYDGIIGVLFRYMDYTNYYTLEIGGATAKFIQFRKNVGGRFITIQKSMGKGYELGKWYTVTCYISGTVFKTFFYETGQAQDEAFPSIDDEDLKEGTIGLSSFMTTAGFDNLKFFPLGDLKADQEEGGGGGPDMPEDIKQAQMGSNEKFFDNKNIKKINWDICLASAKPEEREKYCNDKFAVAGKDAIEYCMENYCQNCCEKVIDWLHQTYRLTCVKQCNDIANASDSTKEWEACINPPIPTLSTYKYCDTYFENAVERSFCKRDMCDLCCASAIAIKKKVLSDESIHDCHVKCLTKFFDHHDIIF